MSDDQQPPPGTGGGPRLRKEPGAGGASGSDGASGAPGPEEAPRRFVRSRKHKIVGGVCGGLGRYFDLDPVVFRVPLAVLSVIGGLGLVCYGLAWLLVPLDGRRDNELRRLLSGRGEGASLSGVLIALVGCAFFLASVGTSRTPFSSALLVAGAVAAAAHWSQRRRRAQSAGPEGAPGDPAAAQAAAEAPPETEAPPVPATPSWWREPAAGQAGRDTGYLWGPDDVTPYTPEDRAAFRRRRRRERQSIGGLVCLLAALAALFAPAESWASEPLSTSLTLSLGSALAVLGLGIAVSAFVGRVGVGTVLAVLLTGGLLAGAAVVPEDITTRWDDTRWAPAAAPLVRDRYELGTGRAVLDLTGLRLDEGQTVRSEVRLGAGELRVRVPDDVRVRLRVDVGVGGYRLPASYPATGPATDDATGGTDGSRGSDGGRTGGGLGAEARHLLRPAGEARGTLVLRLKVGVGEAVVVREEAARGAARQPVRAPGTPPPAKRPPEDVREGTAR
ncbi:PspC domain-containing protein [Streptomyces sp. JJ36]|uniref:PspC domain-containing protein n=1 Tax=Streptomyces sp. JJ36 TaxID=2736645 RepID=UPI001F1BADEE|nr:PspC domain-containing protein [Streptomyces sp. JJ36]MCF6526039.1 PspC domain-containing protein [Streptomyces sp. JJ36]